jgi:hypothetical protein
MHASYHLYDDALIWFQRCEHDLGCWDNFARTIQLRFGPPSYDDLMELLTKLKHVNSIEESIRGYLSHLAIGLGICQACIN